VTVALSAGIGSKVAGEGQQINVSQLLNISSTGPQPSYLVVSLLDRDEYNASSNGETGTLSDNGQTLGLSSIGGDSYSAGIVFSYNASTGSYTNTTYGNLANLIYTASTNTNDNTSISFFTTNNASLAKTYANDPYTLEQYSPALATYVGSISVVTQPAFVGSPVRATPNAVESAALGFVGKAWNMDGCWVLASNISAEAGASLPITSTSLGIPGVASGEWIVAYNGPAGQTGNWQSAITAGEMVVFETSSTSGHITTVVSGSGSSAMLVDNITYVNQSGQIVNSANDGSADDVTVAAPHLASQEWASAIAGSVVVYELDCPVVTITAPVSTVAADNTTALAPLFSCANPLAGQAVTAYQFYDVGVSGAASDSFMVGSTDEAAHSASDAITVNAANLSTVDLLAGSSSGTDTVDVRAFNGSYWGDWESLTVDVTGTAQPAVSPTPVTNPATSAPAGLADIFLQSGSTVVDWVMQNGLYSTGNVLTAGAAGFKTVGTGDFNGDGTSDLLLQSGDTVVDWMIDGGSYQSGNTITTGATGFNVVGTGDFNGDGTSDVLLQDGGTVVDWIMQNGKYQTGNVLTTGATGYTVVGTGDFNGDATSDVLLQSGGTIIDWIIQHGQYQSGNVLTTAATGYTVVGTGDFTGDGTSDVLLQNGGTVVDWIMKNGQYQSGNVLTTGATGYTVVGTSDFNGNGTSDVLLQNGGTVVDWIMKNGVYQSGNVITTAAAGYTVTPS
jgi:hypothetical protein